VLGDKLRWKCECGHVCTQAEMDHVKDPNPLPGEPVTTWLVCPRCRTPENWTGLCDEPGCNNHISCGWPSDGGYRNTCGTHYRK
jgi:hypothetical protein